MSPAVSVLGAGEKVSQRLMVEADGLSCSHDFSRRSRPPAAKTLSRLSLSPPFSVFSL